MVSAVHKDREKGPDRDDNNAELVYVHANSLKPRQVESRNQIHKRGSFEQPLEMIRLAKQKEAS